ncbi:hypothetical protein PPYR_04299 [Photinus pyralis]|uniref:Uncharacterized protein n=1 Tax=Photinus pyralis TaxID=7054 RepID=A0A5N4AXV1_PHOPY|nr:hypothetical protein PPYR_04299 [Photinus pyralis]
MRVWCEEDGELEQSDDSEESEEIKRNGDDTGLVQLARVSHVIWMQRKETDVVQLNNPQNGQWNKFASKQQSKKRKATLYCSGTSSHAKINRNNVQNFLRKHAYRSDKANKNCTDIAFICNTLHYLMFLLK